MAVPVMTSATVGSRVTASWENSQVRDAVNFLLNPPTCRVYGSADWLNIAAAATWYSATFNSESYDTDTMHDTVTNTSRITIHTPGKFEVKGSLQVKAPGAAWSAGNKIQTQVLLNGATVIDSKTVNPMDSNAATPHAVFAFDYQFATNDYIELQVQVQSSLPSGAINPGLVSGIDATYFMARWVSN